MENPKIVLVDDHGHGAHWHITKTIAFDKDDNMYIPFSAPSNACQDLASNLGGATAGVLGADPCPELGRSWVVYGNLKRMELDLFKKMV
jgi:glucose/arabinose dehydrogenase